MSKITKDSNKIITVPMTDYEQNNYAQLRALKGNNNGTWGFGMYGAFFPNSLNGPFGSVMYPMPNDNQAHALLQGPSYNAKQGNYPAYNANYFQGLSGPSGNNIMGTNNDLFMN
jgi:hypothetical protein